MRRYTARVLIVSGFALMLFLRFRGIDLPEGRLLVEYGPYWALGLAVVAIGTWIDA